MTGPARRSALDPGPEAAREAIRIIGEAIARWNAGLGRLHPAGTAHDPSTGGLRRDWRPPLEPEPLPEHGEDLEGLVSLVSERVAPDAGVVDPLEDAAVVEALIDALRAESAAVAAGIGR